MKRFKGIPLTILLVFFITGCDLLPYLTEIPLHFPEAQATATSQPFPTAFVPTATLVSIPTLFSPELVQEPTEASSISTPAQEVAFALQEGNPFYLPNFAQPEAGCSWLGVAGQVFDADGDEMLDLTVMVGDAENPDGEPMIGITGTALAYGRGGYEIQLGEGAIDSWNRFWIQVYSPDGISLTEQVYFTTFEDCDRNLVLVNFIAVGDSSATKSSTAPTPTQSPYP